MFAKVIADRYARAALNACPDLATIEIVLDDLMLLRETWNSSPEFRKFLLNPKVPPVLKKRILDLSLKDRINEISLHLLFLLVDKKRQDVLPDVVDRYEDFVDQVRGVEHAKIITAWRVPEDLERSLKAAIQKFSLRQVEVSMEVDPEIGGGVIVKLGDRVIDGSLRRRFEDTRRAMLALRITS